jgi:hypothetical protein
MIDDKQELQNLIDEEFIKETEAWLKTDEGKRISKLSEFVKNECLTEFDVDIVKTLQNYGIDTSNLFEYKKDLK